MQGIVLRQQPAFAADTAVIGADPGLHFQSIYKQFTCHMVTIENSQ